MTSRLVATDPIETSIGRVTNREKSIHAIRLSCIGWKHRVKAGLCGPRLVCDQVSAGGSWRAREGSCGCSCL
jgi:hypothetical protein